MFGDSRIRTFLSSPILKKYEFIPIAVEEIRPSTRLMALKRLIEKADVVVIGLGGYTYIRRWVRQCAMCGFKHNKPMLTMDVVEINEGWSMESLVSPSPFQYLKWAKREKNVDVYSSSFIFDGLWIKQFAVPKRTVSYRLEGKQGLFDEFAPFFNWVEENGDRNFPYWVEAAMVLAGKSV